MAKPLRARREPRSRRDEAVILLPFFGIILLMPPILNLFVVGERIFGAPPALIYLFSVWLAMIIGAILVSRAASFRRDANALQDPARDDDGA